MIHAPLSDFILTIDEEGARKLGLFPPRSGVTDALAHAVGVTQFTKGPKCVFVITPTASDFVGRILRNFDGGDAVIQDYKIRPSHSHVEFESGHQVTAFAPGSTDQVRGRVPDIIVVDNAGSIDVEDARGAYPLLFFPFDKMTILMAETRTVRAGSLFEEAVQQGVWDFCYEGEMLNGPLIPNASFKI